MSTVVSVMDRPGWDQCTDNIVVVDPQARSLLWVPRDLWCEGLGDRINRAFAGDGHDGLRSALAENGIIADHSLCLQRGAVERAVKGLSISVPVSERLEFWYPLSFARPTEEGNRKRVVFAPPEELLDEERVHHWLGARFMVEPRPLPLLDTGDFARMRRQQTLIRRLLEEGFDFRPALDDPKLVSESGPAARQELAAVDPSWRLSMVVNVRVAVRDGKQVLVRAGRFRPAVLLRRMRNELRHRCR